MIATKQARISRTVERRPVNRNEWSDGQPDAFAVGQEVRWLRNETSLREGRIGEVQERNLVVFDAQQKRHTIVKTEITQWRPA